MIGAVQPPSDENILRTAPETPGCASHAKRWVLAATSLGSSLAFLQASVINVALPRIQETLAASAVEMQWLATTYTLMLAALTVVSGAAGDRYGPRRLFLLGTAGLGLASIACALAGSATALIAGRALQGVAGALLVPNSLALLSGSFPKAERGKVIGTWSAATALTGALGPILGGWLVDHASWPAAFLLAVPLALVTLAVTHWRVPAPPFRRTVPAVDWWGALLAAIALGAIVFAIIASGGRGAPGIEIAAAAVVAAAAVALLAWIEKRAPAPMLPLDLFRSRAFVGANLLTLLLYFAISAVFFLLPFNLIVVQGYSATQTGAAFLPFALLVGGLSRWVGGLGDRSGPRRLLLVGSAISAAGFLAMAAPGVGGDYATTFLAPILILGCGVALTTAPLTATVMASVAPSRAGVAAGVNNTTARLAAILAVAVIGVLALQLYQRGVARRLGGEGPNAAIERAIIGERRTFADTHLPDGLPPAQRRALELGLGEAFVESFRWVCLFCAGMALGGTGAAALLVGARVGCEPSSGEAEAAACRHLDQLQVVRADGEGCGECLRRGDTWVHLRLCLSCGHVGCCDSSKNRHATAHFWSSRHPVVQSLEAGEEWRWCYIDEVVV